MQNETTTRGEASTTRKEFRVKGFKSRFLAQMLSTLGAVWVGSAQLMPRCAFARNFHLPELLP